jgi:hypothetical protein
VFRPRLLRVAVALLLLPPLALIASTDPSAGQKPGPDHARDTRFSNAADLVPANRASVAKSTARTSRLARSDANLLARTDPNPVQIVVKLDYDALATYDGSLAGYAATSPTVTGRRLANSPDEQRYTRHIESQENRFLRAVAGRVPAAKVGQRLRVVYGGIALTVPANKLRELAAIPGVVAVQADQPREPLTDGSGDFIGADREIATDTAAGAGVVVGVLDTGVWPEHPSFAEGPANQPAPAKADGTARACDFGDNPTTKVPFQCNRKLIGGAAFLGTYLQDETRAKAEKYHTARDSDGHGTHTASTAAGNALPTARVFGTERGPLRGVAPGAWVSVYKVCGRDGCFSSDSAAGVGQAIKDGVQTINYSISGGTNPETDPVELAFLDAYAAGVFVAASAGNSGPAVGTANHLAPWVTTVAASTQRREFTSTLTLRAGSTTAAFTGASITAAAESAPVVMAESVDGYSPVCGAKPPAGAFAGKIVACQRGGGIGRVDKGNNIKQGGAVGMILYNPTLQDVETDNHWLPTVHLSDGTAFKKFMTQHPQGVTGSFTAGAKRNGRGDVMAAFSSRGPAGRFVKPDVTAPGVQILAGHTPTPDVVTGGPPGELFQAIAGTSMSSPHVAGAAAWLKSRFPDWTPGRIRSALMTTATTAVVKEDLTTPADPFDMGAGRIRVDEAARAGLVFDETPARLAALSGDDVNGVHLNLPSVNAPTMPGRLTTVRTATNVTGRTVVYRASATAPGGSSIQVNPAVLVALPGRGAQLSITIRADGAPRQIFGQVTLEPVGAPGPALHLPVAFIPQQGAVTLRGDCSPASIAVAGTTVCSVTAANTSFSDATVDLSTSLSANLAAVAASGAAIVDDRSIELRQARLPGTVPGTPSIEPGQLFGYVGLDQFGLAPDLVGDEEIVNYDLPKPVTYGGRTYNRIGVTSNGYLVVGGGDPEDVQCCDLTRIPDPARPNNVLAPFWTDLDGTGAPGILAAVLTGADGSEWVVVEWQVNVYNTTSRRTFQAWLRLGAGEEIGFAYPADGRPADPGMPFLVGAENVNGSGGAQLPAGTLPSADLLVTSSAPTPGGAVTYNVTVRGEARGAGVVTTQLSSPQVPGVTTVSSGVRVR